MQSTGDHNNLIAAKANGESNIFAWRPVITRGSQTSLKGLCDGALFIWPYIIAIIATSGKFWTT